MPRIAHPALKAGSSFLASAGLQLALALVLASPVARAQSCASLTGWRAARANAAAPLPTIAARSQAAQAVWQAREESARALFVQYRRGELDAAELDRCLSGDPERQSYLDSLYGAFYEGSLAALRVAHGPAVGAFLAEFDRRSAGGQPLFRVMGFSEATPAPLPGGYQRAVGSLYLHFGEVSPNDWLVLFTHELLHAVDEQLWAGVSAYSAAGRAEGFASQADRYPSFAALPPADQAELRSWLLAGLDRGLLAEYRAWSATFAIYLEGLQEGLWKPIPWMEELLASRRAGQSLESFTFSLLDARSPDPAEGIFLRPLLRDSLRAVRAELRRGPAPPLANLEGILRAR